MSTVLIIRAALSVAFSLAALLLTCCYLFPSLRGPKWTDTDLLLAIVFALLALVCKPELMEKP